MIKVTCPPATVVNQLNTSYIIDILVITFPTAHLCKIYLTLILSIQRWAQFSKWMVKVVVLNVGINSRGITIIPSVILHATLLKVWTGLLYLAIFWANTHVLSTFIQADLIYLHWALGKQKKRKRLLKITKVISPITCFNSAPFLKVMSCVMFSCINQNPPQNRYFYDNANNQPSSQPFA